MKVATRAKDKELSFHQSLEFGFGRLPIHNPIFYNKELSKTLNKEHQLN